MQADFICQLPASLHSCSPPYMQVWVREPEKQDGVNRLGLRSSHYTYCVRTEATLPSLRAEGTEVRRRFSEFDVSNPPNCPPKNDGNCESLVGLDATRDPNAEPLCHTVYASLGSSMFNGVSELCSRFSTLCVCKDVSQGWYDVICRGQNVDIHIISPYSYHPHSYLTLPYSLKHSYLQGLHKLLRTLSRGYIVPPVPEKSFLDARLAQEDFLRLRRADLQV